MKRLARSFVTCFLLSFQFSHFPFPLFLFLFHVRRVFVKSSFFSSFSPRVPSCFFLPLFLFISLFFLFYTFLIFLNFSHIFSPRGLCSRPCRFFLFPLFSFFIFIFFSFFRFPLFLFSSSFSFSF